MTIYTHSPSRRSLHLPTSSSSFFSLIIIKRLRSIEKKRIMKIWFAALLLVSLFFTSSFLQTAMAGPSNPPPVSGFCDSKCKVRCSKASIWDGCYKYCTLCCSECKCVPSGTYGHKDECPCYRDKLSSKLTPKCP